MFGPQVTTLKMFDGLERDHHVKRALIDSVKHIALQEADAISRVVLTRRGDRVCADVGTHIGSGTPCHEYGCPIPNAAGGIKHTLPANKLSRETVTHLVEIVDLARVRQTLRQFPRQAQSTPRGDKFGSRDAPSIGYWARALVAAAS